MKETNVFISQPMNGLSDGEIHAVRMKANEYLEKEGYTSIYSYITDEDVTVTDCYNLGVLYLAMSLELMSKCSTVYFCKGWQDARGCVIEHAVAKSYGLNIIYEEDLNDGDE